MTNLLHTRKKILRISCICCIGLLTTIFMINKHSIRDYDQIQQSGYLRIVSLHNPEGIIESTDTTYGHQFHIQDEASRVEIGNYPIISAYANFHLKRTRFFVMMSHVNCGMGNSNYFYVPHYPLNQGVLKMGISWNFYD